MAQAYIGPWQRADAVLDEEAHWRAPEGATGAVDMRPLPEKDSHGVGVFVAESLPSEYTALGDVREQISSRSRGVLEGAMGIPHLAGGTLSECIANAMTVYADSTGEARCKPIMPTHRRDMQLILGGEIWAEKWRPDRAYAANTLAVVHDDLRALVADVEAEIDAISDDSRLAVGERQALQDAVARVPGKVVDAMTIKYGVDVVPADLTIERGRAETVIGDTFVGTNGTSLDAHTATGPNGGFGWTEFRAENFFIQGNKCRIRGLGEFSDARAESDLSSSDMRASAVFTWNTGSASSNWINLSVAARYNPAATNAWFYEARYSDWATTKRRIVKQVNGSGTNLVDDTTAISQGARVEIEADGSTIRYLVDGNQIFSITDTDITGYVRAGISGYSNSGTTTWWGDFADWLAEDLLAPPAFNPGWVSPTRVIGGGLV